MPKITQLSQLDLNRTYSYADYFTWQLDERVELIKGKISFCIGRKQPLSTKSDVCQSRYGFIAFISRVGC